MNPGASPTEAIPYILERVVVCSRGSAFDARLPRKARLDDYVVLTKQLHDISESNFDYRDLRHVGFLPNRKFVDRVTSLVAQALQNKRAVLIFECSKGRHRSVAASLLACYLFEHFIGHQHVVLDHLACRNWHTTCGGECTECSSQPTDETKQIVQSMIDRVLAKLRTAYTAVLHREFPEDCSTTVFEPDAVPKRPPQRAVSLCRDDSKRSRWMRESSPHTKQTCLARTYGNPSKLAKICQLVGTACACLPWGLLTYGCIDFPGFGINGYPEVESKCKIESTGICGRYTHTCDNLFEADKIQSKQIGKLIFSTNNSSEPAKTCIQSIRNILFSFSAHEQRFSAEKSEDHPTSNSCSSHRCRCLNRSGIAGVEEQLGDQQLPVCSHANGLQGGYDHQYGHAITCIKQSADDHRRLMTPSQDHRISLLTPLAHASRNSCEYKCTDLCELEVGFDTEPHFEHTIVSMQRDRITSTITAQLLRHADCQKSEQQKHCSNNNCQTLVSTAQHCTKTPCSLHWIKRLTLLFAPRHNMQSKPMYRRAGDPEVAPPGRRPGETFQDQIRRVARGGGGASGTTRRGTTPRPSQSPTLQLFAHATGSAAVDVLHSTTDKGDAPERVVILSQGVRYLRQNPGHGLSLPASPVYLHDLRSCRNPQHDVSHRGTRWILSGDLVSTWTPPKLS